MGDVCKTNMQKINLLKKEEPVTPQNNDNFTVRILRSCCIFPQRYIIGVLGLFGMFNAYTMRVCLNIAITQMVNHTKNITEHYDPDACPSEHVVGNKSISVNRPYAIFDWSEETQGLLLSGFYYGYIVTQLPGGYLSERFGGKWVLGLGLFSTAIFTILTPVVIRTRGASWLFILRVLQGIGEGPAVPALMTLLARWVPPDERSFQGALVFGGAQIGNILGSFMSGTLLADGKDWANVFYVFGSMGIFWFVIWSFFSFSTPDSHPFISKDELTFLKKTVVSSEVKSTNHSVPWKAMLRSAPVWALVWASVGHDWGYYTMVSDLPKYSHDVLKFDIATTGILTALPYIAMWVCSFPFGYFCSLGIRKGWHSVKMARIIYTTIAAVGPAIFIVAASYAGCDRNAAMICFILSMGLMSGFYSGMKVNSLDLAPNYIGSLVALCNTTSTLSGIITPYLVGLLTPDSTLAQWRLVFWVCFAVLVVTSIIYTIWADGKQQWWDDVQQYGYPEGWKHGPLGNDEKNIKESEMEKFTINLY